MSRETFLSYGTLLNRVAELCRSTARDLELHVEEANARYERVLRDVVVKQKKLADQVREYADEGPTELLDTRLQFADEALSSGGDSSPETVGAALQNLMGRNGAIERAFADQAEATAPEGIADLLRNLSDLFASHSRAVAWNLAQARDL